MRKTIFATVLGFAALGAVGTASTAVSAADPAVCDAFLTCGRSPLRLPSIGLLEAPELLPPLWILSVSIRL